MASLNLNTLQRQDSKISSIIHSAMQSAVYKYDSAKGSWEKTGAEGTFFVCSRTEPPVYIITVLNKLSRDNFVEGISIDMEVVQQDQQYLLYRKGNDYIRAIWFFNGEECSESSKLMSKLIEVLKRKPATIEPINGVVNSVLKSGNTDIVSMLNKAQTKHEQQSTVQANLNQTAGGSAKPKPIEMTSLMQQAGNLTTSNSVFPVGPTNISAQTGNAPNNFMFQKTSNTNGSSNDILNRLFSSSTNKENQSAIHENQVPPVLSSFHSSNYQIPFSPGSSGISSYGISTCPINGANVQGALSAGALFLQTPVSKPSSINHHSNQFVNSSPVLLTPADFSTSGEEFRPIMPDRQYFPLDKEKFRSLFFEMLQDDDEFVTFVYGKMLSRLNKLPNFH